MCQRILLWYFMQSTNFPFNLTNKNPLIHSPFVKNNEDALIAPGVPKFVETDDLLKVTTDDGEFVTTDN